MPPIVLSRAKVCPRRRDALVMSVASLATAASQASAATRPCPTPRSAAEAGPRRSDTRRSTSGSGRCRGSHHAPESHSVDEHIADGGMGQLRLLPAVNLATKYEEKCWPRSNARLAVVGGVRRLGSFLALLWPSRATMVLVECRQGASRRRFPSFR